MCTFILFFFLYFLWRFIFFILGLYILFCLKCYFATMETTCFNAFFMIFYFLSFYFIFFLLITTLLCIVRIVYLCLNASLFDKRPVLQTVLYVHFGNSTHVDLTLNPFLLSLCTNFEPVLCYFLFPFFVFLLIGQLNCRSNWHCSFVYEVTSLMPSFTSTHTHNRNGNCANTQ